jgi:hypothetical protein
MNELLSILSTLIRTPTADAYRRAHRFVVASAQYAPYSNDFARIQVPYDAKRYSEVCDSFARMVPNWLLSPRAHMAVAAARKHLGDEQSALVAFGIARALLAAIRATGDGTPECPYLVVRVEDEYDVLADLRRKNPTRQTTSAGLDTFRFGDGATVVFDARAAFARLLGGRAIARG